MKKLHALAWLLAAALPVSLAATLPGPPVLIVTDAWARKAPGVDTAAVYLSLSNTGVKPIIVVGVQSPACRQFNDPRELGEERPGA